MAFDPNDEIAQDFLVSSGELLDQLDQQLVSLEQTPDDKDLLNAVFRNFHTIKGGAGFLALKPLVDVCHRAEDVFNQLRRGERQVTPQLMDVVLKVYDTLTTMFQALNSGQDPEDADPVLLEQLEQLALGEEPAAAIPASPAKSTASAPAAAPASGDITDQEFEALLDALQAPGTPAPKPAAKKPDEITDDEFENLLDELHGKGKGPAVDAAPAPKPAAKKKDDNITDDEFENLLDELHGKGKGPAAAAAIPAPAAVKPAAKKSDDITDDEFESLLDNLHGKGKGPSAAPAAPATTTVTPKPAAARPATPAAAPASGPAADTSVRVDTQRLDDIMNMVGELVLVRNRLLNLPQIMQDERAAKAMADLNLVTADLQVAVMKTRMQPISKVYGKFPRVVRDLARSLKKEVNLEMRGEETEVDKNLVEMLGDPLVHLVRNAVDHGVEMPDVREKAGKPRTGTLLLAAEQAGDHILLTIADDGAGMDPEVLRRKAVEKGLLDADAAARLTETDCFNLIFAPGFSTKTEISDVSGRGVGMDVVRTKISQLNGVVEIESERGKGTRMLIKVPLTLAIMPALMVVVGGQIFAVPLTSVGEIIDMDLAQTSVVDGQHAVLVRGRTLPLFYMRQWLAREETDNALPAAGHVVVAHVSNQKVGLIVDGLIGQEEVVIKPLGARLQGTPGLAGATITGDGRIALILDLPVLVRHYARRVQGLARPRDRGSREVA